MYIYIRSGGNDFVWGNGIEDKAAITSRKYCKGRKRSPSCRAASSAPAHRANYRESNASRLRQEIKGMTITGIVGRIPRSKSSSPTKRPSRPQSGSVTPQSRHGRSPEKTIELIATPRTVSEMSNLSRETQERFKVSPKNLSGYVVDTRSKTLNTIAHPPNAEEVIDIMANKSVNIKNTIVLPVSHIPERSNSSYGKPLVTPVNKKLTILRDKQPSAPSPQMSGLVNGMKTLPVNRNRPPIKSWRADNRNPSPSTIVKKLNPSKPKLPTKSNVSGSKLPASNTNTSIKPDAKVPVRHGSVSGKYTKSIPCYKSRTQKTEITRPRDVKSWSPDSSEPPPSRTASASKVKTSLVKKICREPVRKISAPLRDLKGRCKDLPSVSALTRPNSAMHSNKSFKPQLEDIKSSYLLLNKKPQDKDIKTTLENEKIVAPPVSKPRIINEEQRKEQLLEAKKKFQSKKFWDDAKYDKIEGLNWISWK